MGIFNFLPEYYWFESHQYDHIYLRTLFYKATIFVVSFIPILVVYYANQKLLDFILNKSQVVQDDMPSSPLILRLKQVIQAFIGSYESIKLSISNSIKFLIYFILSLFIARFIGFFWNDIVLVLYHSRFLLQDPIFERNIGFYIFKLPVYLQLISTLKFIVITMLFFSLWNYLKRGYFTLFFSPTYHFIRLHIFGLLVVFFILNALSSYFSKYQLLFKNNDIIFGAGFTDINFYLKAITLFPLLWIIVALLSCVFIFRPNLRFLIAGLIIIFIPTILFLKIVPSMVQNYVVTPNEFKKEVPFIKHNIAYTQAAYQLDNINDIDIKYEKTLSDINDAAFNSTLNNVRLWNPGPLKSTLKQLQEIRLYYEFKNIDIDRYFINGAPQQVMLSARELDINQISQQAQTWVNKHLIFTHGYGLCLVPVNAFNEEGLPELYIRDIPPVSNVDLTVQRPEIYFGESTNHYVIANTKQKEFDYPKDNENRYTHYNGTGGIKLDSFFKRLIYSIKLKDIKILISQNIHSRSRLMYDRNVHVIPEKITPFIVYDNDPYIVINENGRLVWMVDGYTSSRFYPYSTPYANQTNYIRNSVLATVDAYTGETHFYIKDSNDPIVASYSKMYPNLFKSLGELPTALKAHIRFPKDLFKITSKVYNTYHMNDPQVFYNKEDVWTFPTETYDSDTGITMEPYYMFVQNPKTEKFEYVMMMPLTPSNKNNLVAILTASCDPNHFGEFNVYKLPKQETVYGPLQIESRIDQNTEISKDLTLWGQVGSRVIRGNLMVIPYKNSILYIEPIYLQATQSKLPELKRVIVAFGDKVTMSNSIYDGISDLTQVNLKKINSTAQAPSTYDRKLSKDLTKKIVETYSRVKETLKTSDWAAFGKTFEALDKLMIQLKKEQ